MSRLGPDKRVLLQQFRLQDWADRQEETDKEQRQGFVRPPIVEESPSLWKLTHGITLFPWQEDAVAAWFRAGRRGAIKVVTGAGKTLLALAIAERLQREVDREVRIAIVVPTIVLMNQWRDVLLQRSNLPEQWIGRLGGGHEGRFGPETRVLICVLASASKFLPGDVKKAGLADRVLLVLDECHRAGAPEMKRVLTTGCAYSLGLSATPERDEDADDETDFEARSFDASAVGRTVGPIVYEMTFDQAIDLGVLPAFELRHYGLSLTPIEHYEYEALSRSIREARDELLDRSPSARKAGGGKALMAWCRRVAERGNDDIAALARRYVNDTARRKRLLYGAGSRAEATVALLREAFREHDDTRAILFHESIDEVAALFDLLVAAGLPAVLEHSKLPMELREESLRLFGTGEASIIVSARSLIEGYNVPAADLGIIVASSSSPRQRIQSIGRVLRKHRTATGEEKTARICILYVRNTVDEAIYSRQDWGTLVGVERNLFFAWDPPAEPQPQEGPPREAVPAETEIDLDKLAVGDPYPGRYEGAEYSCDRLGNVRDASGQIAHNPQGVPSAVQRLKGGPGRFRVTRKTRAILVLVPQGGGWETLYGGVLREPFRFDADVESRDEVRDISSLKTGDPYPGPLRPAEEYRYRRVRGGVISKRVRNAEVFASGPDAEHLVHILRELSRTREFITKFHVNRLRHAFWRENGAAYFLAALTGDLEFPDSGTSDA